MHARCDCGAFEAELTHFPAHSPGRLMCYCDDCQRFLEKLGRPELLDAYGGTEVVPVYPCEIHIIRGREQLVCNQLSPKGLFRWSSRCCNSPLDLAPRSRTGVVFDLAAILAAMSILACAGVRYPMLEWAHPSSRG